MKPAMIVIAACVAFPASSHAQTVDTLGWLSGCWVQDDGVKRIDETWLPPAGGTMFGIGRTVKGGEVRNSEFMRIGVLDGRLTFTADPSGQEEASFPALSQTDGEIVFENTAHDFPQRVIYRHIDADHLQAAIEGPMDGELKTMTFDYGRCR